MNTIQRLVYSPLLDAMTFHILEVPSLESFCYIHTGDKSGWAAGSYQ